MKITGIVTNPHKLQTKIPFIVWQDGTRKPHDCLTSKEFDRTNKEFPLPFKGGDRVEVSGLADKNMTDVLHFGSVVLLEFGKIVHTYSRAQVVPFLFNSPPFVVITN